MHARRSNAFGRPSSIQQASSNALCLAPCQIASESSHYHRPTEQWLVNTSVATTSPNTLRYLHSPRLSSQVARCLLERWLEKRPHKLLARNRHLNDETEKQLGPAQFLGGASTLEADEATLSGEKPCFPFGSSSAQPSPAIRGGQQHFPDRLARPVGAVPFGSGLAKQDLCLTRHRWYAFAN